MIMEGGGGGGGSNNKDNKDNRSVPGEEIEIMYGKLGSAQRGRAELLGVRPPKLLQGSIEYGLEHIGDLVHRLSYNYDGSEHHGIMQGGGGIEYGRGAALEKVKRAIRYSDDYGLVYRMNKEERLLGDSDMVDISGEMGMFVKYMAKKSYIYYNGEGRKYYGRDIGSWEEEWDKVKEYLGEYVKEHKKLTPLCYSYYQKLGNLATISLGKLEGGIYIKCLYKLEALLEDKDWAKYWYSPTI